MSCAAVIEGDERIASFALGSKPYNGPVPERCCTLPNLLTLSRIFAVPILVFLLWRPLPIDYAITFVLYCIVGITDYFDGYLARAQGRISRLGQFLDPIADKIMVAAVLMMLISSRKANPVPEIDGLNIIPALIILLREIIVSGLREYLAPLNVSMPVSRAREVEDDLSAGRARRAHPRRCGPERTLGPRSRNRLPVGCRGPHPGDRLRLSAHRHQAHGLKRRAADRFCASD